MSGSELPLRLFQRRMQHEDGELGQMLAIKVTRLQFLERQQKIKTKNKIYIILKGRLLRAIGMAK